MNIQQDKVGATAGIALSVVFLIGEHHFKKLSLLCFGVAFINPEDTLCAGPENSTADSTFCREYVISCLCFMLVSFLRKSNE